MRKWMLFSCLMVGLVAYVGAGVSAAHGMEKGDKITLKLAPYGSAKTDAKGDAKFMLSKGGDALYYAVTVKGLKDVKMAHIHEFKDGKPGGIIVWLYPAPGAKPYQWAGTFSGTLGAGVITGDRLEGPGAGKSAKDVFEMLEHGQAVVAIHTAANPDGELAGLAKMKDMKDTKEMKGY